MNHKNSKMKYLMSYGHFCADFTQGALSAVLPFLIASHSYNYATAATLVMISNLIGSVIQPVFGYMADKIDRPHLMTLGVILAGGGMCMVGFLTSYAGLCVAVVISGIGVAMFHPQGARMVNRASTEENIGMSMGIFSFGGNAGFTIGPVMATAAISIFGLKGTLAFFIPAIIFSAIMAYAFRGYETQNPQTRTDVSVVAPSRQDQWGAFVKLGLLVTCRSVMFSAISTFLILYFVDIYGLKESVGSVLLSVYYGISAFASLLGGKMADGCGYKKTLVLSGVILLVSIGAFALCGNIMIAIIILLPLGVGISLGYSAMVTLGQQYLPNHVGLASGVTLGLSVSIGGIAAPFLGKLGDAWGLEYVFYAVTAVAAVLLGVSLALPAIRSASENGI